MAEYHQYVFDVEKRTFVGQFEEMYRAEDQVGFDSWRERDLRVPRKRLALEILSSYNFGNILEIGCGKGTFTQFLKRKNNCVVAIDISTTAIEKARHSYPDIDFRVMSIDDIKKFDRGRFDLIVIMGTLAYIENWQDHFATLPQLAPHVFISEYIPPNPIGFVKSIDSLVREFSRYYHIETKLVLNDTECFLMGHLA